MSFMFKYIAKTALILSVAVILAGCEKPLQEPQTDVRLGWQPGRLPQGQVLQALQHTDILDELPLSIAFAPFRISDDYSNLDAVILDEESLAKMLSVDDNWTIISRASYNLKAIYFPPDAPIESIADLDKKRIGVESGSLMHSHILELVAEAGMIAGIDVRFNDLDLASQIELIHKGSRGNWGRIDAVVNTGTDFVAAEVAGDIESYQIGKLISVMAVSNRFIQAHPDAVPDLLIAFMEAYLYFARNFEQTAQWFREETQTNIGLKALKACAATEYNTRAFMKGHVSLHLSDPDLDALQSTADFLFAQGAIEKALDLRSHLDLQYLRTAEEIWYLERDGYPKVKLE